jgi:hypothetical protein
LTAWHQDIFAEVAAFCRKRQAYCHNTATIPQVAVLHSQSFYYRNCDPLFNFGPANCPMEGALHALLENGYSVDILNEETLCERIAQYAVVVVAEQDGLPPTVTDALKAYVQNGGRLLMSGSHLAAQCSELAGVAAAEGMPGSGYVPADNGCVTVSGPWQNVTLTTATELAPLFNQQEPALNKAGTPAATLNNLGNGIVVAVHGPVFRAYYQSHYPRLRRFIADMVDALDATNVIRLDGPWWIEMSARQKDGRTLIQFVNRSSSGHLTPNRHMVEHVPDAGPFSVTIPMAQRPTRVFMAPDETGIEWTWSDGVLVVKIAGLAIHNVLVIESAPAAG